MIIKLNVKCYLHLLKKQQLDFIKKLGFKSIPDDEYDMHYLEIDGKKKSKRKSKKKKSKRKWSKQK